MDMQLYRDNTQVGFTSEQEDKLAQKLDGSLIYHRDGQGGKKLAYIKGSTAIAHANRIFGYGRWGYRVISQELKKAYDPDDKVTGLFYATDVELYVAGSAYPVQGCGAAAIEKPYMPMQYENARKSSVKDALKLALVNYGDQFGLALYDADAEVELNGETVSVREVPVNDPNRPSPKRIVEAGKAPKQLSQPEQITFIQVYNKGLQKGKWTKETFPSVASGILNGHPINKDTVAKLTAAQLAQLDAAIEQEAA